MNFTKMYPLIALCLVSFSLVSVSSASAGEDCDRIADLHERIKCLDREDARLSAEIAKLWAEGGGEPTDSSQPQDPLSKLDCKKISTDPAEQRGCLKAKAFLLDEQMNQQVKVLDALFDGKTK